MGTPDPMAAQRAVTPIVPRVTQTEAVNKLGSFAMFAISTHHVGTFACGHSHPRTQCSQPSRACVDGSAIGLANR